MKKILLTGSDGQLGHELCNTIPDWVEMRSLNRGQLDICDAAACLGEVREYKPDWIINAAAFTDVEKAESEPEAAMRVNRDGIHNLAMAARSVSSGIVHISTDFVFDGKLARDYVEDDVPNPLNSYGISKLAGEEALHQHFFGSAIIIRTSWLYSPQGKNFVKTILRLLREKPSLAVISDQIGVPTSPRSLAHVIYKSIQLELNGLFHWCDAGQCSWYEFACEIQNQALEVGLIAQEKEIRPISAQEYPSKVHRPSWSVMSQQKLAAATKVDPLLWQNELKLVLQKIRDLELADESG